MAAGPQGSFAHTLPEEPTGEWNDGASRFLYASAARSWRSLWPPDRTAGTRRWRDYIFGARNNIHIIDLAQTVPLLHRALQAVSDTVAKGGRVLFVGTKRQAQDGIAEAAKRSAQYYVNHAGSAAR